MGLVFAGKGNREGGGRVMGLRSPWGADGEKVQESETGTETDRRCGGFLGEDRV